MPRPKKTTESLALSGAFEKNPSRAEGRSIEASSDELPPAPEHMPEEIREAWEEIRAHSEPGLLRSHHWLAVREGARLLAKSNADQITGPERAQLWKFFEQFGMTPRARAYVSVKSPDKKSNPYSAL